MNWEESHASFGLGLEATAGEEEFAFKRGEEALAHGVVVGVPDRAHRWLHAGFSAAPAELERRVLAALVGVMRITSFGRRVVERAISSASSTSEVASVVTSTSRHMRRLQASRTTAKHKNPTDVGT